MPPLCSGPHEQRPTPAAPSHDDFTTYVFRVLPTGRLVPGKVIVGSRSMLFSPMHTRTQYYAKRIKGVTDVSRLINLAEIDRISLHNSLPDSRFTYTQLDILRALAVEPTKELAERVSRSATAKDVTRSSLFHRVATMRTSKKSRKRVLDLHLLRKIVSYRSSYLIGNDRKITAQNLVDANGFLERFFQLFSQKGNVIRFARILLYDGTVLLFYGLPRKIEAVVARLHRTMMNSLAVESGRRLSHSQNSKDSDRASLTIAMLARSQSTSLTCDNSDDESDTISEDMEDEPKKDELVSYQSTTGTESFSILIYKPEKRVTGPLLRSSRRIHRRARRQIPLKPQPQIASENILTYMTQQETKRDKRLRFSKRFFAQQGGPWDIPAGTYAYLKEYTSWDTSHSNSQVYASQRLWQMSDLEMNKFRTKSKDLSDSELVVEIPVQHLHDIILADLNIPQLRMSMSKQSFASIQHGYEVLKRHASSSGIVIDSNVLRQIQHEGVSSLYHERFDSQLKGIVEECMQVLHVQATTQHLRKSVDFRSFRGSLDFVMEPLQHLNQYSLDTINDDEEGGDGDGNYGDECQVDSCASFDGDLCYISATPDHEPAIQSPGLSIRDYLHRNAASEKTAVIRSQILRADLLRTLISHFPRELQGLGTAMHRMRMLVCYNLRKDGRHLMHIYNAVAKHTISCAGIELTSPGSQKLIYSASSLLLLRLENDQVCGAFMSEPINIGGSPNGSMDNFVFRIQGDDVVVYHPTGANAIFQVGRPDCLTFGAGGGSALVLQESLETAQTWRSDTYGNVALFEGEEFPRFRLVQIVDAEVIAFARRRR